MTSNRFSLALLLALALGACSSSSDADLDGGVASDGGTDTDGGSDLDGGDTDGGSTDTDGGSTDTDGGTTDAAAPEVDCDSSEPIDIAVCAATAFLDSLSTTDQDTVLYDFSDSTNKTCWSNLPGQSRPGITFGDLSDASRELAMALAGTVFSTDGYQDYRGILAADDYLGEVGGGGGGGGPGGSAYTSDNAHIAIFGTPSATGDWMLSLGNHHMAYNITFLGGTGYPSPSHLGAEPRLDFTVNGETFAPLESDGQAFVDLFAAMSSTEVSSAYISGTFSDTLFGPVEYCTGSYDAVDFPTGSARGGLLVSELDSATQALVTAAIAEWVEDYDSFIADDLMAEYSSAEAFADTYLAWGGSGSAPDVTVNGTYFRIDGPRLWLEVACQNGVVLTGTHYHTIYRDRDYDYGNAL